MGFVASSRLSLVAESEGYALALMFYLYLKAVENEKGQRMKSLNKYWETTEESNILLLVKMRRTENQITLLLKKEVRKQSIDNSDHTERF